MVFTPLAADTGWTAPQTATVVAAVIAAAASVLSAFFSARASRAVEVRKHRRVLRQPVYDRFDRALGEVSRELLDWLQQAPFDRPSPVTIRSTTFEGAVREVFLAYPDVERYGSAPARKLADKLAHSVSLADWHYRQDSQSRPNLIRYQQEIQERRQRFRKKVRNDLDLD